MGKEALTLNEVFVILCQMNDIGTWYANLEGGFNPLDIKGAE